MKEEKLNPAFDIPLEELEERLKTHFNGDFKCYNRVIPLKQIKEVHSIHHFAKEAFESLIRGIPLREKNNNNNKIYPYKNASINVFEREPKGAEIGQTFLLERKIRGIMEGLENKVFSKFIIKGLSKRPPSIVYGSDSEKRRAIAFYVPPFVEIHGNHAVIIDGMHRSYICDRAGTTIETVHLTNVEIPLPFKPIPWQKIKLMQEKPPNNQRYEGLREEYFRDLSIVGIDG